MSSLTKSGGAFSCVLLAQSIEHLPIKQRVPGLIPGEHTNLPFIQSINELLRLSEHQFFEFFSGEVFFEPLESLHGFPSSSTLNCGDVGVRNLA